MRGSSPIARSSAERLVPPPVISSVALGIDAARNASISRSSSLYARSEPKARNTSASGAMPSSRRTSARSRPARIHADVGAVGHHRGVAHRGPELGARVLERRRIVRQQQMAGARQQPRSDPVAAQAARLVRVDLVHRPHDPVAEAAREAEAQREESELQPRERALQRARPAPEAPLGLRPVEMEEADSMPRLPEPAQPEARALRQLVAVPGQLAIQQALVRIRVEYRGQAHDLPPQRQRAGGGTRDERFAGGRHLATVAGSRRSARAFFEPRSKKDAAGEEESDAAGPSLARTRGAPLTSVSSAVPRCARGCAALASRG